MYILITKTTNCKHDHNLYFLHLTYGGSSLKFAILNLWCMFRITGTNIINLSLQKVIFMVARHGTKTLKGQWHDKYKS
jgi:hypothetical protein